MKTFLIETILPWILGLIPNIFRHEQKARVAEGGDLMNYELIYSLVQKIYCEVLKAEAHKLAGDTNSKVDDVVVGILDKVFGCEGGK